ncbi:MAG: VOC family protein [Chloroflexi bacterium]|nr:VOC family protein [Chloroflexota bacterium]
MATDPGPAPLIRQVDCIQIPVSDLDAGLAFYRDKLGHELIWRTDTAAGLRLPESKAEIVLQTERPQLEPNLKVDSADEASQRFVMAGGSVVVPPFDVAIGRCVVVQDPFGNRLVLLDMTKGRFVTDEFGNVTGNA